MMTQKNSKISKLWKYVLLVPALVILTLVFGRVESMPSELDVMKAGFFTAHEGKPLFLKQEKNEYQPKKETKKTQEKKAEVQTQETIVKPSQVEEVAFVFPEMEKAKELTMNQLPTILSDGQRFYVLPDSSDNKKKERFITWWKKGEKYELKFNRESEITEFKVDGKIIPEAEYEQYFEIIEGSRKGNFAIRDSDDDIEISVDGDVVIDIDDEELLVMTEKMNEEMSEIMVKMPMVKVLTNVDDIDIEADDDDHGNIIIINGKHMSINLDEEAWEEWGKEWEKWGEKWEEWADNFEVEVENDQEYVYRYKFRAGSDANEDKQERMEKELEQRQKQMERFEKQKEKQEKELQKLKKELEELKKKKEKEEKEKQKKKDN